MPQNIRGHTRARAGVGLTLNTQRWQVRPPETESHVPGALLGRTQGWEGKGGFGVWGLGFGVWGLGFGFWV